MSDWMKLVSLKSVKCSEGEIILYWMENCYWGRFLKEYEENCSNISLVLISQDKKTHMRWSEQLRNILNLFTYSNFYPRSSEAQIAIFSAVLTILENNGNDLFTG